MHVHKLNDAMSPLGQNKHHSGPGLIHTDAVFNHELSQARRA